MGPTAPAVSGSGALCSFSLEWSPCPVRLADISSSFISAAVSLPQGVGSSGTCSFQHLVLLLSPYTASCMCLAVSRLTVPAHCYRGAGLHSELASVLTRETKGGVGTAQAPPRPGWNIPSRRLGLLASLSILLSPDWGSLCPGVRGY